MPGAEWAPPNSPGRRSPLPAVRRGGSRVPHTFIVAQLSPSASRIRDTPKIFFEPQKLIRADAQVVRHPANCAGGRFLLPPLIPCHRALAQLAEIRHNPSAHPLALAQRPQPLRKPGGRIHARHGPPSSFRFRQAASPACPKPGHAALGQRLLRPRPRRPLFAALSVIQAKKNIVRRDGIPLLHFPGRQSIGDSAARPLGKSPFPPWLPFVKALGIACIFSPPIPTSYHAFSVMSMLKA